MSAERLDEEDRERVRERERGEVSVRQFFPSPGAFFCWKTTQEKNSVCFFSLSQELDPKVASNLSG